MCLECRGEVCQEGGGEVPGVREEVPGMRREVPGVRGRGAWSEGERCVWSEGERCLE